MVVKMLKWVKNPNLQIPIIQNLSVQADPSERLDSPKSSSNGHTLYMMELYKDYNHTELLSFDDGPAPVVYDDKIYVRTWIESGELPEIFYSWIELTDKCLQLCQYKWYLRCAGFQTPQTSRRAKREEFLY